MLEERQNTATLLRRAELLVAMFDKKQTPSNTRLIEQEMLDQHHPTWVPKRSNNDANAMLLNPLSWEQVNLVGFCVPVTDE